MGESDEVAKKSDDGFIWFVFAVALFAGIAALILILGSLTLWNPSVPSEQTPMPTPGPAVVSQYVLI